MRGVGVDVCGVCVCLEKLKISCSLVYTILFKDDDDDDDYDDVHLTRKLDYFPGFLTNRSASNFCVSDIFLA